MSGAESSNDKKLLHVVFQRAKVFKEDDFDQHLHVSETKLDHSSAMKRKLYAMGGDYDRKHPEKDLTELIEAIKDSCLHEDVITEKFVYTVESMMTLFSTDLDRLQKIYSNVLKNLPNIEAK